MVKVGITGCDNVRAAELVRILINHPDVELMWIKSASAGGLRVDHIVPGIIGECDLTLSTQSELEAVDVIFTCGARGQISANLGTLNQSEGTHIIDLSGSHNLDHGVDQLWKYGLPEMQRRVLVHDTQLATVPGSAAVVSLLALMPLARNQMLHNPLALRVEVGEIAFLDDGKTIDGLSPKNWAEAQQQEVEMALRQCQADFDHTVNLTVKRRDERRTIAVEARFKCDAGGEMVRQLYDQYYDDHNFVFMVDRRIVAADVENTNKCLIRLDKDDHDGVLTVQAMMDVLLKGSAGNAVHVMNLMFGLHERVGLTLKGTGC